MVAVGCLLVGCGLAGLAYAWFSLTTHLEVLVYGGILAICLGVFCFIAADTESKEEACRAKGGQVVHYGRYGSGVDCILVPR